MKELEETNCEIRNVINLDIPPWDQLDNLAYQEDTTSTDGSNDSNRHQCCGGFLNNECKYAWLSRERRLIVLDARYGKCISTWSFPDKITSVCSFPMEPGQVPLLLIGTDNHAIRIKDSKGYLYVYDCNTSRVLTTIQVPAGIEQACIIHGGTEWEEYNEKRPDTVLSGNSGLIFAALRNLQHLVIDANRLLWQNALQDGTTITAQLEFVNEPASTKSLSKNNKEPSYLAYDLMDREIEQFMGFDRANFESTPLYDENLCSVLLSSTKTGCLISGCLGRVIIWQSDGSIGWISPPFDENAYVTHVALLEPSDDPRPFYYLWIACQNDSADSSAVLRMYAMLFGKKHCDKSGESSLYFNLESEPSLKFELELEQGERVHSLTAVEREPAEWGARRGEDSVLMIGSDERVLLFDLNRWYKEQMPRTMAECRNPNSVMASYRTTPEGQERRRGGRERRSRNNSLLASRYLGGSLRELAFKGPSSPEELFYPNALGVEWLELGPAVLSHWLARGVQSELLRELSLLGPALFLAPGELYRRCLACGLVPFDSSPQDLAPDASPEDQRQLLLSVCLEQRWASFLLGCALDWADGSAAYLYPEFLHWGVRRASALKLAADQLSVPLFDQSGLDLGEAELRTLRLCAQQLHCLAGVVSRLPDLSPDLERQRRALRRISTYLQVLLWFHDVGLLPESQTLDPSPAEAALSPKIPYPREQLAEFYRTKRQSGHSEADEQIREDQLFVDLLMSRECAPLKTQWQRESGGGEPVSHRGLYPPPSLQTLLRSFLADCYREQPDGNVHEEDIGDLVETQAKHSLTIYLLLDLANLLQSTRPNVDRLIKYPSAFMLNPSTIKLTQAFWLLDHDDYEGFFNYITGELVSMSDVKDWHHKLAIRTLLQNDQHKLALTYLRVLKPPLSTLEEQGVVISLSVEQGLVESAFHARPSSHYSQLLTRFFQACKANGKLKEILLLSLDSEEEEAFVKFLKENDCEDIKLLYFLQRCRHAEAKDLFAIDTNRNPRRSVAASKVNPVALKMLGAFNNTLPAITRHFANTLVKSTNSFPSSSCNKAGSYSMLQSQSFAEQPSSVTSIAQGYPKPMSQCRIPAKEIYDVAVQKTRETCLKAGRVNTSVNYVPFLGAPCSTIVFCTRASGNVPEYTDANCVLFPERKVSSGKRTLGMMNDENADGVDGEIERKRRRLGSSSEINLSNERNQAQLTRRLSMSQVCDTPLIQRKNKDPSSLAIETPHSILKIRQMLQRNSNSPGFSFNVSSSEREGFSKPTAIGDARPARQIRFSVERFSGNEDSLYCMDDTNQEQDDQDSNISNGSKNTDGETGTDEAYYSPNASMNKSRDSSILTDSSVTKYFHGPRPRPSLRRSSLGSRASSDYLSHKTTTSNNSTLSVSTPDISIEKNKNASTSFTSQRKSLLSNTVYNASILSPNTSGESSPFKRPFAVNDKRDTEEETEDSEDQSEEEEDFVHGIQGDEKNVSALTLSAEDLHRVSQNEDTELGNKETEPQAEISDDEEIEKTSEHSKNTELEEGECESFQSFPESLDNTENSQSVVKCIDQQIAHLNDSTNRDSTNIGETRNFPIDPPGLNYSMTEIVHLKKTKISFNNQSNISITENINLDKDNDSSHERSSYSLTKPIFIDSRGMVKLGEPSPDITDDESMDYEPVEKPELESVIQSQNEVEDEENDEDLKLTLSSSDDNAANTSTRTNGLSSQEDDSKPSGSSPVSKTDKRRTASTSSHESSLELLSVPSILIEDVEKESIASQLPTTKKQSLIPKPSPRRPIRSSSSSPAAENRHSVESISPSLTISAERDRRTTTKEIKKVLSQALDVPKFEPTEEKESTRSRSSSISQSSERKISRTSSKQSSREPSQDKDVSEEISTKSKVTTQTTPSELAEQTIATRTRARAGSTATEVERPTRKTKAASVVKDNATVRDSSADSENWSEEPVEKKARSKKTKAASTSKNTIMADTVDEIETQETEKSSKTRATRASSQAKDVSLKPSRRARAGSVVQEEKSPENPVNARKTRAGSVAQDQDTSQEKTTTRKTRAGSVAQDEKTPEKPAIARKTRAGSVAQDEKTPEKPAIARKTRAGSVAQDEKTPEKPAIARKTRGGSVALEDDVFLEKGPSIVRKTRAGSVVQDQDTLEENSPLIVKKTRGASVAREEDVAHQEKAHGTRKTRAGSVVKDEEVALGARKTRATSVTKETQETESADASTTKRITRAASVTKETSTTEHEETLSKRPTRKRGGSVPKEVPPEPSKAYPRNRRSVSLLQEVILEESLSQLDSPISKRSHLARPVDEALISSPAANTRSRRSSIQSVPEDLEEKLSVPDPPVRVSVKKASSAEVSIESRSRRATSVDSSVIVPTAKRLTRSVLAKTAIIEQVIPEETAAVKSIETKKQPARRKRATSVPVDIVENAEKAKPVVRPKRGRKVSESKVFEFSVPEEAGELPENAQGECRTPTYEFSKPAGFQKFILPVPDDEDTFDMRTNLIRPIKAESERATSVRMRQPRTCFVMPKKTKNKIN